MLSVTKAVRGISWFYCFNAFFLVIELTDYVNWFVFPHYIVVFVSYMCAVCMLRFMSCIRLISSTDIRCNINKLTYLL